MVRQPLTPELYALIDAKCDQFEKAWHSPNPLAIESLIEGVPPIALSRLVRELLQVELELRRERGEQPSSSDYLVRFPAYQQVVYEVFADRTQPQVDALAPAVDARSEQEGDKQEETRNFRGQNTPATGKLEVRCPSCHEPMEVAVDTLLTDLTCSSCGSHFSLIDQSQDTRLAPVLSKMGRFELIERIGFGGCGSVWKAIDRDLDRTVAIKLPRWGEMSAEGQERFFREARAAAQLRHPNIVSVHEVGRDGETIYIVSDFVRGVTLSDWLTGQPLSNREAAELCTKVARALHHAHEQGVVHRDLKPANIMIDGNGEPHLLDFGLALRETDEVTITIDGRAIGTAAYMSPEQAVGQSHTADRRSDVYSLGVILYELLTGERPFRGNRDMLIHQAKHEEPRSPRRLNDRIPRDLDTICMKCLQKSPDDRYATAAELADELDRWQSGMPIHARPVPMRERALKWVRRHPVPSGLVAALCVTVLSGIAGLVWHNHSIGLKNVELRQFAELLAGAFESASPIHLGSSKLGNAIATRGIVQQSFLEQGTMYVRNPNLNLAPAIKARLLNSIGSAYLDMGKLSEALDCLNESLAICIALDENQPSKELASTLHNAGFLSFQLGRYAEAESRLKKALDIQKSPYVKNDISIGDVVITKVVLAATLLETQRGPKIKELLEEVVADRPQAPKGYDRDFAIAELGLALVSARLGEDKQVVPHCNEARKIMQESGDKLVDVLELAVGYVGLSAIGQDKLAAKSIGDALSRSKGILGESHPIMHVMKLDLAKSFQQMGDPARAEAEFRNILLDAERLFGDQPRTAEVLYHLGDVLRDLNKHDEAVTSYKAAKDMLDKYKLLDPFDWAEVNYRLGMMALLEGQVADARTKFKDAIKFQQNLGDGMHHPVVAFGHIGLALANSVHREQELDKAVDILRKSPGDIPSVVAQLASLGDTFRRADLDDHAKLLYEQALRINDILMRAQPARKLLADGYPVGRAHAGLGQCLHKEGHGDPARPYLERAAKIFEVQLGAADPRTVEVKNLTTAQ